MKIRRLLNILCALSETGKVANDMYDLDKKEYYYKEKDKYICVMDMSIQHLIRDFVKLNCNIKREKPNFTK